MLYSKYGSFPQLNTDGRDGWIEVPDKPIIPEDKELVWWYPPGWVIRDKKPNDVLGYVWKWIQPDNVWKQFEIPIINNPSTEINQQDYYIQQLRNVPKENFTFTDNLYPYFYNDNLSNVDFGKVFYNHTNPYEIQNISIYATDLNRHHMERFFDEITTEGESPIRGFIKISNHQNKLESLILATLDSYILNESYYIIPVTLVHGDYENFNNKRVNLSFLKNVNSNNQ